MKRVPFIGSKGRPTKSCKECKGNVFWLSKFGEWFASATSRQSPDSMPIDNQDIKQIHELWKRKESAGGWSNENGRIVKKYDYHMCHRDPAKGNGFQGRFTYGNLLICDSETNQSLKNTVAIDHGYRVYTDKAPFGSKAKVKRWCSSRYQLLLLVEELGLTKQTKCTRKKSPLQSDDFGDFLPQGTPPEQLIASELKRFNVNEEPWKKAALNAKDKQKAVLLYGIGLDGREPISVKELDESERQEF